MSNPAIWFWPIFSVETGRWMSAHEGRPEVSSRAPIAACDPKLTSAGAVSPMGHGSYCGFPGIAFAAFLLRPDAMQAPPKRLALCVADHQTATVELSQKSRSPREHLYRRARPRLVRTELPG